jgi:PIN domain nuclease of toxin-antitoxin system
MRLLLDTHVLLWALADSPELARDLRRKIADPSNDVLVSAASVWEIAIKKRLGKLDAPDNLLEVLEASDFSPLFINFVHAAAAGSLPPHHDDPFDRMLIAQAQSEGLILVTADRRLRAYHVELMQA